MSKGDVLEKRLKRSHVRLIEVLEKSGLTLMGILKSDSCLYLSRIPSSHCMLCRGHIGCPTHLLPLGVPPLPVIILLHYRDRDAILMAARNKPLQLIELLLSSMCSVLSKCTDLEGQDSSAMLCCHPVVQRGNDVL